MKLSVCAASIAGTLAVLSAQEPVMHEQHVMIRMGDPGPAGLPGPAGDMLMGANFGFISAEMGFHGTPVTGAPYSAESVTGSVQTLADGNRITHQSTSTLYRDSGGRTRREETLSAIGPWAPSSNAPMQTIFISDPVAGVSYILNAKDKTATKIEKPGNMPHPSHPISTTKGTNGLQELPVKTESLGVQTIEGLPCTGTRTTMTIPAGRMGNERDLVTVSEIWVSADLKMTVSSQVTDPRMGQTTTKLQHIVHSEPSASLFQVPSDYQVTSAPGPMVMRYKPNKE